MKQNEVFKKIGGIIEELSEQYEYLKTVTDDLNDLELELFAANSHFLVDHIEVLCKLNFQRITEKRNAERLAKSEQIDKEELAERQTINKTVKPAPDTPEPKYFEPVVQQMKYNVESGDEEEEKITPASKSFEFEIATPSVVNTEHAIKPEEVPPAAQYEYEPVVSPEPETIRHELVLDESMLTDEDEPAEHEAETLIEPKKKKNAVPVEERPAEEIPEPVFEPIKPAEPVVVEVVEEVLTINQKIFAQAGDKTASRTEQLSIKPISDLKLAITLNDKLLYVKDLFNGYNLAYSEAIEILNRFNTFDEAARFLKTNYVTKNNWDGKPATVEKFYTLLKRRYA